MNNHPHPTQSRLSFLLTSALLSLATAGCSQIAYRDGSASTVASGQRPNIIFIFTDDHASHAISAYGSKINTTPNLDRLAAQGMLFRNAFCTNSICAPSRAVILTGKHSHLNGVIDNRVAFDGAQQTFPKLLQNAAYQTAMIGKWHLKSDPTGFDYWQVLPGQGHYYNPEFKTPEGQVKVTGYVTDIVTDLALDWLKTGRDADKPFMMMYQHKAPHREWAPGPNHLTMYDDVTLPEPPTLFDDYANRTSAAKQQEMTLSDHMHLGYDLKVPPSPDDEREYQMWKRIHDRLNDQQRDAWDAAYGPKNEAFRKANLTGQDLVRWKYQRYVKDYLRCIASVDDNIGRLLDYLDQSGLAKNTIVIYSSDQGFYLGDHGWFDKRWMYEESLRMPLIVRWPGVTKPGSENKDLVQNLDFAETFLDIAGVKQPADMQGHSIVPLLKGKTPDDWRESIYYHYYEFPGAHMVARHYGVRTDRHKLIHYYEINEWELFDLENDPDELKSVYDDPANAGLIKRLKTELTRLQAQYGDIHPAPLPADAGRP
jgi:arylsulfatase A-like enzyme